CAAGPVCFRPRFHALVGCSANRDGLDPRRGMCGSEREGHEFAVWGFGIFFFLSFWIACSLFGVRRDCGFFLFVMGCGTFMAVVFGCREYLGLRGRSCGVEEDVEESQVDCWL